MIKEAIEKILDLAPIETLNIEGSDGVLRKFSDGKLFPIEEPMQDNVTVMTLSGLVELITCSVNGFRKDAVMLVVKDHERVELVTRTCNAWGRRQVHAVAQYPDDTHAFEFGEWTAQEPFIIAVSALFEDTPDKELLLRLVSNLTSEQVSVSTDDGISQKASVRVGLALKGEDTVKRIVTLKPRRTFCEIDQPESEFLVRLRSAREGQLPTCALFEADGGAWKLDAMNKITAWLGERGLGIPIIA